MASSSLRGVTIGAPLAFSPPHFVAAIANGTFRQVVTVTTLARDIPYSWNGMSEKHHSIEAESRL
jgi:hypothetical protein